MSLTSVVPSSFQSLPFQGSSLPMSSISASSTADALIPKKQPLFKRMAGRVKGLALKLFHALYALFSLKNAAWIGIGVSLFFTNLLLAHIIPTCIADYGFNAVKCSHDEMLKISFAELVLLAPLTEEVLFRGAMQPIIRNITYSVTKNKWVAQAVAVTATALFFGSIHCANGTGMLQVVVTTVMGIAFGILNEKEGLDAPTLAHVANNLAAWTIIHAGV